MAKFQYIFSLLLGRGKKRKACLCSTPRGGIGGIVVSVKSNQQGVRRPLARKRTKRTGRGFEIFAGERMVKGVSIPWKRECVAQH